jgi:signal recognition particle receptor subunit beta
MSSSVNLRDEIVKAIQNISSIERFLAGRSKEETASVGVECLKAANALREIVSSHQLPEAYKVAVVGRFKVGKSSFVNELLSIKLAGEDTSPETAAVTTFTFGSQVEATINLIEKSVWENQKQLFHDDPKNIDAHRAKMWDSFSKPKKTAQENEEKFDLVQIEQELIHNGSGKIVIKLNHDSGKSAEKEFRANLKKYTSGNKPYHCLVSSINITTPSTILKEGIELIDTPGLGDTERFRVSLTEKSVENVDAILLLTKSGVAYGQEEKDFLVSILRKGIVKQLLIVVTQVDQTYQQHVKASRDDDEEPQSVAQRVNRERSRIRSEILQTLEELSGSDSTITRTYLEQFRGVEIVFTSVQAHRDSKSSDLPGVVLGENDPGGLIGFKHSLSLLLSTESRLAITAKQIIDQSRAVLIELGDTLEAKLNAVRNTKNSEEVERRLNSFRTQFKEICQGIATDLDQTFLTFKDSTEVRLKQHETTIENIVLKAGRELGKFRTNDVGKHWRTRRSSNWGYMNDLQNKVANRVFPIVQGMLEEHVEDFSSFVRRHERKLSKLTRDAEAVAANLDLGRFTGFDIKKRLKESAAKLLDKTHQQIVDEQEHIIKLLDSFVTEEVEDKISERRQVVADIWGRGTSYRQQSEVIDFYDSIESILGVALSEHIASRNANFAYGLVRAAEHSPKETFQEIDIQLESAINNLREVAELTLDGQKEYAERLLLEVTAEVQTNLNALDSLFLQLPIRSLGDDEMPLVTSEAEVAGELGSAEDDWATKLLYECKVVSQVFHLRDGQTGWPYSRIFEETFFRAAEMVRIVDPFLIKHHQRRNLKELLLLIAESAKPKVVEVFTNPPPLESEETIRRDFDDLSTILFRDYGIRLEVSPKLGLHDRYVFADNGHVAKFGRGLDIYKPSAGLASHRQESRKVRECDITVWVRG